MTKPMTPGEREQRRLEQFRGPPKSPRPQHMMKPASIPKPKQIRKSPRGK